METETACIIALPRGKVVDRNRGVWVLPRVFGRTAGGFRLEAFLVLPYAKKVPSTMMKKHSAVGLFVKKALIAMVWRRIQELQCDTTLRFLLARRVGKLGRRFKPAEQSSDSLENALIFIGSGSYSQKRQEMLHPTDMALDIHMCSNVRAIPPASLWTLPPRP